ncbi:response regulator transcription factor [Coraliomargarita sp. SDUM461003]|uniref:Response regulator transcription factor n=1 Tax=Thalassobacterium maritimum TaxID=3041265 RepID=A0ABU1AT82_9BACT|nr:response regulator transcription factor [Coraliomargarita sp. SDUM461003]MDQ8207359.1 response regulator transcription factor [Coraliomargarita sp. SDUM461003]
MKEPIKIMLVEDNREYRDVIDLAMSREEDLELVSEFVTAEIALRSVQGNAPKLPDVVLLDLRLPGMSGLEVLPYFTQAMPRAKVIILTQSDSEEDVLKAISLGASGYLLKSSTITEIKDGIRLVVNGGASLDPSVAKFVLKTLQAKLPTEELNAALSGREQEVLVLISEGLMKKEICDRLGIGYATVDTHVRHIYEKLDVKNAPAAVTKAFRLGLFD